MTASEPLTTVSLSDPGDLIAATPALLGFVPRSSLVAMSLGGASGRRLGLTLRSDLPPPEHVAEAAEKVVGGLLLDHPAAVVVIVIGPGGDAGPPAVEFVERVMARLAEHGVDGCHALWTGSTVGRQPVAVLRRMRVHRAGAPVEHLAAHGRRRERKVAWSGPTAPSWSGSWPPSTSGCSGAARRSLDAAVDAEADATFAAFADLRRPPPPRPTAAAGAAEPACCPTRPAAVGAASRGGRRATGSTGTELEADRGARRRPRRGAGGVGGGPRRVDGRRAGADPRRHQTGGGASAAHRASGPTAGSTTSGWWRSPGRSQIPVVRDAAVAACTGSRPAAAEALWAALARGTPDPEAAEPAALLALMGLAPRRRGAGQRRSAAGRVRVARSPPHGDAARSRGGGHPPERAARLPDRRTRAASRPAALECPASDVDVARPVRPGDVKRRR